MILSNMTISLQTEIASNFEENSNVTAQNAVFAHYSKDINLKPSFNAKATENASSEENSSSDKTKIEHPDAVVNKTEDLLELNSQILDTPILPVSSQPSHDLSDIFSQAAVGDIQPKPQYKKYMVLCAFDVDGYCAINNLELSDEFMSVSKNETVFSDGVILDDWVVVQNEFGKIGKVPAKYIRIINDETFEKF